MTKKFGEVYSNSGENLVCMFVGTATDPRADALPDLYIVLHDDDSTTNWEGQVQDFPADWGEKRED